MKIVASPDSAIGGPASLQLPAIHRLIEEQVMRSPEADAVAFGGRTLSYEALNAQANQLAHHLRELGVRSEVLVGICMERSLEMVVAYIAVLKAGGAFVPLDPDLPAERLALMLTDTGATIVLTQARLRSLIHVPRALELDTLLPRLATLSASNLDLRISCEQLAYVIYTSGSTGRPKGVMVPHGALSNVLLWCQRASDLRTGDRMLQKTSIGFDPSLQDMLTPLLCGATTVMAPIAQHHETDALVQTMRDERITHALMVPSQLRALLEEPVLPHCTALRHVGVGGEVLDVGLAQAFQRLLPLVALSNFYGPTEATIVATHCEVPRSLPGTPSVSIGRPIANTQCFVLNEQRQPVGVGVVGQLFIGGAGLARGYLNSPTLTAERFVLYPLGLGQRVYATGDLVRWLPDRQLEYVGRTDDQVKIRGVRIELGEIEASLNALPGVQQAVVLLREDVPGFKRLVAYVVGPQTASDAAALRQRLQQRLPSVMVPATVVRLPIMPLLPSGKVDRLALPVPLAEGIPVSETLNPDTPTEKALAQIWQDVLRLPHVGRHDHFFDLGGHSLLATQVASRLRTVLQVELPLRAMFQHPVLSLQAAAIDDIVRSHAPGAHLRRPSMPSISRAEALPVSFSQRRMWLVQQMNPDTTAYNMPLSVRLRGDLNADKLAQALDGVAQRHEAFRTRFELVDGTLMQFIDPHRHLTLERIDLRHVDGAEREGRAQQQMRELTQLRFDLSLSGLHRAALVQMGHDDHILMWVMHHAVSDFWSYGVLLRDLSELYASQLRGERLEHPVRSMDYADYASWQRHASRRPEIERQLTYGRERLKGISTLNLPVDLQRRSAPSGKGGQITTALAPQTIETIKRFSLANGVTPFMAMLACFKILLARYCGQEDVAVATPIANRHMLESEQLVGTFVNTLVMRTDLSGNPDFLELLARVKHHALDAFAHQDASFEQLVEQLVVPTAGGRDNTRAPLVQVMFNVVNAPIDRPSLGNLTVESFVFDAGAVQFDLALTIDTELFGEITVEYAGDLFERATAQRVLESYLVLLEQVLANPHRPVRSLDFMSPAGRAELTRWNQTAQPYAQTLRVDQTISECCRQHASAVAMVSQADSIRFGDLELRANRLARALRQRGIGRGALVGLCVERGIDMVIAQLAILKAGAAYVPLDPAYPADRLAHMAQDAELALLVTESALTHALDWPREKSLLLDTDGAMIAEQSGAALAPDVDRDARLEDPAYVIYTSGSTGKPKGVVVHHRGVVNFLTSMAREPGLAAGDRLVAVTTLSFDIAVLELLLPLSVGARVVLASRDQAMDGASLRMLIERSGATVMQATPSTWRVLIDAGWQGSASFKALIGGEGLPQDLAAQLLTRTGELWNMYGPTETTVWSTCWKVSDPLNGIFIGAPIANTTVHILDEAQQPVPIGVPGEIYIGGDGVTLGYLHRAQLTAERFVPDPFKPGARLYRTGDRGRWRNNGLLEHQGRLDYQVKVRGHRIELGEIESTIAAHAEVSHAVVIVREDTPGDQRLVAYVVPKGEMPEPQTLREHLRLSLPDYMIPQHFVTLPTLPLLPNGKIDRGSLPEPQATSPHAGPHGGTARQQPQTVTEIAIAGVWAQLLGVQDIGRLDSFFDLGGHSLLAMRAVTEINRMLGMQVTVRDLIFNNLAQLAAQVAATAPSGGQGTTALQRLTPASAAGAPTGLVRRLLNKLIR